MTAGFRSTFGLIAASALAAFVPDAAHAAATSLLIDPSVRSAGMGGVATSMCWSSDPDEWANPALLGYQQGLSYRWSRTRLVPDLASDVYFRTNRFAYGWGGVGLGGSSNTVDYGTIDLTNSGGTIIGTYEPVENYRSIGVGFSLSRFVEAVTSRGAGNTPAFARYADVAIGFAHKHVTIDWAPASLAGRGSTNTKDLGVLIGVSPIPRVREDRPFLELAYGFAALSYDDASITFIDEDVSVGVERHYRNGLAMRVGIPITTPGAQASRGWFAEGIEPFVTVSGAVDFAHVENGSFSGEPYDVEQVGLEIDVAGIVAGRLGHVTDRARDIDGHTFGFGIGLPIGRFAGLRYDFARYPEARTLQPVHRHAVQAWLDPVAMMRR